MKKNFIKTVDEIEKEKNVKKEHVKKMVSLAMSCLLGIVTTTIGVGFSVATGVSIPQGYIVGGSLTCTSIGLMIKQQKKYNRLKNQMEDTQKENIR